MNKLYLLQWGEMPTSVAYIGTGQIMGWGNKAIEVNIRYPFFFSICNFNQNYANKLLMLISDSFRGNWSFRWSFYAQKSSTSKIPLRT